VTVQRPEPTQPRALATRPCVTVRPDGAPPRTAVSDRASRRSPPRTSGGSFRPSFIRTVILLNTMSSVYLRSAFGQRHREKLSGDLNTNKCQILLQLVALSRFDKSYEETCCLFTPSAHITIYRLDSHDSFRVQSMSTACSQQLHITVISVTATPGQAMHLLLSVRSYDFVR